MTLYLAEGEMKFSDLIPGWKDSDSIILVNGRFYLTAEHIARINEHVGRLEAAVEAAKEYYWHNKGAITLAQALTALEAK